MKKKNLLTYSIMLAFAIFTACSSDEIDTEAPVILLHSPIDHQEFHPGGQIYFHADFSDNVGLSQFKIDIHFGEGHDHKSATSGENEWSYEYIGELEGQDQKVEMYIDIPLDALHGEYDLLVYCTDKAGNESFVFIEIDIEEDHD